jgi:2-polyprenyl-3-methyl-5-hydroxy-6-metoxy-1,4-benzoquinol methylase
MDLDQYNFSSYEGLNGQLIRWRYEALTRYFHGDSCLELGSSDGQGTQYLLPAFKRVVAVDGSSRAVHELRRRFPGGHVEAIQSSFEDLALGEKFDTVIMAHILEHVDDPARVLDIARQHLAQDGVIIADVPNARSLHRQVGVELGLMQRVTDLNDADRSIGHQRVYTPEQFRQEFILAGLNVRTFGGFLIKPVSNAQMQALFDETLNKALFNIGAASPEIAAEIYVIATSP